MTRARKWLKQADIDARARKRIASKLSALIRSYDGSPADAKEILRGLVAARQMGMDLRPFEDRLARKRKAFASAA
ncbi:MAG TPA: hypothetical protein VIF57_01110 [Polyangia bacterium]